MTFYSTVALYGLPEHSCSPRLQSTREGGAFSDPYRLFNLDVFEYETHRNTALFAWLMRSIVDMGAFRSWRRWARRRRSACCG